MTHLVWFRNDLRVIDNCALNDACNRAKLDGQPVIAAYVATPKQWQHHHMAPVQADFIYRRLIELQRLLQQLGIPLLYAEVPLFKDVTKQIVNWSTTYNVVHLYYNNQYQINEQLRDKQVNKALSSLKIHSFNNQTLIPQNTLLTGKGQPYRVFTPFKRAWLSALNQFNLLPTPCPGVIAQTVNIEKQEIVPFSYDRADSLFWPVDDKDIQKKLKRFCQQQVEHYSDKRNFPALKGTSRLSPYLVNGLISPRQCFAALLGSQPGLLHNPESGAFCWLNELIWREFYIHLMASFPNLIKGHAFHPWTEYIIWSDNQEWFDAWKQGKTGYPIVDAAMRQLNSTGWMHNRLRMITASFLTKDLLINWRRGEKYFMSQLIDGDFAANNGGWQWCASTGTDSQPYFRIFNPHTQSKRFDPNGEFIRHWLPELKDVPDKAIHNPQQWAKKQSLALSYPEPLIDHNEARKNTLKAYRAAKELYDSEIQNGIN